MSTHRQAVRQKLAKLITILLVKTLPRFERAGKLNKGLVLLTRIAQAIPYEEYQRVQLRQLHDAFVNNHPAVQLARRAVAEVHPKFLKCLIENLWVNWWAQGGKRAEFLAREGFEPPRLAVISPIKECNLQCVGCYASAVKGIQNERLDFETIDRIVTELKSFGTTFIVFTGGEPTHPIIWPTIKAICAKHSDQAFMMYTNGTLIDDEKVADLLELGNLSPAISVEGWEEETDSRRGRGVYARVVAAMDRLRAARILFGFSLTYTSTNFHVATDPKFIDFLMEKGCLYGWYFMYVPVGRDPDLTLVVSPWQRDRIRQFTWDMLRQKGLFIADFWNSGPMSLGCIAGGKYLHINNRGDIEPCVFFKYTTHNIHNSTILDALRSPLFTEIRKGLRHQRNPLTPCRFMDHPDEAVRVVESSGARPSEEGGEALLGPEIKPFLDRFAREYREEYADPAWTQTADYAWFAHVYKAPEWLPPASGRVTKLPADAEAGVQKTATHH